MKQVSNGIIARTDYAGRRLGVWASGKVTQKELLKPTRVYWIIQRDGPCSVSVISSMLHICSDTAAHTHLHTTNLSRRTCQAWSKVFIYCCNVGAKWQNPQSPGRKHIVCSVTVYTSCLFTLQRCHQQHDHTNIGNLSLCSVLMQRGRRRKLMTHIPVHTGCMWPLLGFVFTFLSSSHYSHISPMRLCAIFVQKFLYSRGEMIR